MKKFTLALCLWLTMAIPAFAADSTSLFDTKVLGTNIDQSASVTPVGTVITWASDKMPNDGPGVWLECDGRAIPSDAKYQDLRDYLMNNNTPNYTNQFLRGGTSAQVGQVAADSTRSHAHQIDQHSHMVSGSAGGQLYQAPTSGGGTMYLYKTETSTTSGTDGGSDGSTHTTISGVGFVDPAPYARISGGEIVYSYTPGGRFNPFVAGTPVGGGGGTTSAYTGGGSITGVANADGPTSTHASGGAETAPQHTRVRYLIRALP